MGMAEDLQEIKTDTKAIIKMFHDDRTESRDRLKGLELKMRGLLWFVPALLAAVGIWLKAKLGL